MATTFKQEMPPKGGYATIDYKRALPKRGPSGYVLLGGVVTMMCGGLVALARGNQMRRLWQQEEREARVAITPLVVAEKDRDVLRIMNYNREQEAIIMKDVPGWVVDENPYNTTRWRAPLIEHLYYLDDSERYEKVHGFATYV